MLNLPFDSQYPFLPPEILPIDAIPPHAPSGPLVGTADETSAENTDNSRSKRKSKVLYSVYYEQRPGPSVNSHRENICGLACSSVDLAFDDTTLDNVEDAWKTVMKITGGNQVSQADLLGTYMTFEDREKMAGEEDYDEA
jgi:hypothetical protein